jgi:hypothetical protein
MQSHGTPSTPQVSTGHRLLHNSGQGRPPSESAEQPFSGQRQVRPPLANPVAPVAKNPRGVASRGVTRQCRMCGRPIEGTHILGKGCPFNT